MALRISIGFFCFSNLWWWANSIICSNVLKLSQVTNCSDYLLWKKSRTHMTNWDYSDIRTKLLIALKQTLQFHEINDKYKNKNRGGNITHRMLFQFHGPDKERSSEPQTIGKAGLWAELGWFPSRPIFTCFGPPN